MRLTMNLSWQGDYPTSVGELCVLASNVGTTVYKINSIKGDFCSLKSVEANDNSTIGDFPLGRLIKPCASQVAHLSI